MYKSSHINYESWSCMLKRCDNPNNNRYYLYGGRGIKVCERWHAPITHGFQNFCNDMGERPGMGYDLDRIDPDGDYCKENCRWVDRTTSAWNQRKYSNNLSGVVGVGWVKSINCWRARITKNNKTVQLGCYKDKEDAIRARLQAELELYGEYKIKGGTV